jgi:hypothetical protein
MKERKGVFIPIWDLRRSVLGGAAAATTALSPTFESLRHPSMIRRNPTLIAMSDADVQDVRNLLVKKQQEQQQAENSTSSTSNTPAKGKQGLIPQPPSTAVHVTDESKQRREARDERLGLNN